ncbi:hypothetical protein [Novosphingobium aerophilum]|uniref:Glycosyl hydrolase family 79 n=1 Tax=Novosphingobium aerophilum TaxID=2839843 RepID=A0A7X1FBT2_9SPHN|nr:hypothetical protein [Novosphingobium aerophilum]MBC2653654.1 hypothetical protein [Novosphingobium aerophilum]
MFHARKLCGTICAILALACEPGIVPVHAEEPTQVRAIDVSRLPFVRQTDERFQSYQIGFSHLTGGETWKAYDAMPKGRQAADFAEVREARAAANLNTRRMRNLTKALAPLYIRYSGTTANSVYFHNSDSPPPAKVPEGFTVLLTRERWKEALRFARSVDAKVLTSFANSAGVRDDNHAWTPKMAQEWMAYTRSIGSRIYAAELFNEPNAPEPPRIPKGFSADDYARDYAAYRAFMAKAAPGVRLAGPGNAMLGIGVTLGTPPEQYAAAAPRPQWDIVSYHFYPALAQRCAPATSPLGMSADRALSEEWLARPDAELARFKALRDQYAPGAPIWLTETGGAACGGLIWQPTFLDAFRYADTHARLARGGLDAMFTHALISGSNGIIDEKTLEPNASYWPAVLWRRLMGQRVLDAGPNQAGLHIYAHCLRGSRGGVALLALNMKDGADAVSIKGRARVYALTAPGLESKAVLLNGRLLTVGKDDRMPPMAPRAESGRIELAPYSVTYIAIPQANNAACGA